MDHEPGYKLSAFSWEMGHLILQRMGDRETMRQITADPAMPAYATVFRWVQVHEDFGAKYRSVRLVIAEVARQEGEARRAARAGIRAEQAAARAEAKGKAPRHWKSGRKSSYTPERAAAVLEAIREGASLSAVTATPGMPSFKVFYTWVRTRPEFREAYMDACSERAFRLRGEIEDRVLNANPFTLARVKRKVAMLEGRIGRLRPKIYRVAELDW
jgi:hypothetical protein